MAAIGRFLRIYCPEVEGARTGETAGILQMVSEVDERVRFAHA